MPKSRSDSPRSRTGVLSIVFLTVLVSAGAFALLSVPTATAQSTVNVSIKNFSFNPQNITVVLGVNSTVTWTNNDNVTHTVTAFDNSFSGSVSPHKTFTHTFTAAGVYSYHCSIHNFMKGSVTVLSASPSTTTSSTTTSSGAVPEFPVSVLAIFAITAAVLASYITLRHTKRG